MKLTDILSQYLNEVQYQKLNADEAYQTAKEAMQAAERELNATMTAEQRSLFLNYMDKVNYVDSLELECFFSRCSLLLLP